MVVFFVRHLKHAVLNLSHLVGFESEQVLIKVLTEMANEIATKPILLLGFD